MTDYENMVEQVAYFRDQLMEQVRKNKQLELEANWLAEQLSIMIDDCPTARAKSYCYKAPFCVECWRDAAQKAVQND